MESCDKARRMTVNRTYLVLGEVLTVLLARRVAYTVQRVHNRVRILLCKSDPELQRGIRCRGASERETGGKDVAGFMNEQVS